MISSMIISKGLVSSSFLNQLSVSQGRCHHWIASFTLHQCSHGLLSPYLLCNAYLWSLPWYPTQEQLLPLLPPPWPIPLARLLLPPHQLLHGKVSILILRWILKWNGTYFQTQVTETFLTHFFFLLTSSSYQRISQISCLGPLWEPKCTPKSQKYANFNMTKNAAPKLNLDSYMMDHLFLMG